MQLQPENTGSLSVKELKLAELEIVKFTQRQHFSEEIHALRQKKSAKGLQVKKSSSVSRLDPVLLDNEVLCVGGRLRNASITVHQMILPKKHHVATLLVRHFHHIAGHSGTEHVLSLVRQRFWIVKGRQTVNKVVRDCFQCKRRTASPCKQKMADLPTERVTPDKPAFSHTGVDYFGPLMVRRGRSTLVKRYGCVFTCLASRAIHIEVAHSMDTDSFIHALDRFISRRGCPETITSDNGRNFRGAQREIKNAIEEWNQQKVERHLQQREIQWKFNPPYASHMGGVFERQIRTIRKVLGALLKEQTVDDEGLVTFMCLAESYHKWTPNHTQFKSSK